MSPARPPIPARMSLDSSSLCFYLLLLQISRACGVAAKVSDIARIYRLGVKLNLAFSEKNNLNQHPYKAGRHD